MAGCLRRVRVPEKQAVQWQPRHRPKREKVMNKNWMAAAAAAVAMTGGAAQAQDTFISIGTGGVTGVY